MTDQYVLAMSGEVPCPSDFFKERLVQATTGVNMHLRDYLAMLQVEHGHIYYGPKDSQPVENELGEIEWKDVDPHPPYENFYLIQGDLASIPTHIKEFFCARDRWMEEIDNNLEMSVVLWHPEDDPYSRYHDNVHQFGEVEETLKFYKDQVETNRHPFIYEIINSSYARNRGAIADPLSLFGMKFGEAQLTGFLVTTALEVPEMDCFLHIHNIGPLTGPLKDLYTK